jgi:PIN domain nuclease of toxin-antitoxin system
MPQAVVLLDTQVVVEAAINGLPSLPRKVQKLLADANTVLLFSSVSIMEIALKANLGKLTMAHDQLKKAEQDMRLTAIGFTPIHAYALYSLPMHHRDPFDRMLIATALADGVSLVGRDKEFKRYKGLKVIW